MISLSGVPTHGTLIVHLMLTGRAQDTQSRMEDMRILHAADKHTHGMRPDSDLNVPNSLPNRLLTAQPPWATRLPEVNALLLPPRPHLAARRVAAAGRPTGCTPIEATGDANPAATACTDGGGGRPQRRRGPAHGLRRQPGEEVGARAARVCQMRRERTNGEQARGEEENGLVVSKERARRGPSVAYESRS